MDLSQVINIIALIVCLLKLPMYFYRSNWFQYSFVEYILAEYILSIMQCFLSIISLGVFNTLDCIIFCRNV